MEGLLRSKEPIEIKELFKQSFDYKEQIVLFPIRHHSPACSYHLRKVIEDYKPEVILIEGPENAKELISDLVKEGNQPPFCIYLSYDDQKGFLGELGGKYRAYYPLLAYSPELNALLEAKKQSIPCEFIDLPYHEKLYNQQDRIKNLGKSKEEDRLFTISDYYKSLSKKMNCRSFNELWEKLFELSAMEKPTLDFVESLFTYCYFSRRMTPLEELVTFGDLAREMHMKERIQEAKKCYKKILVVTGGIHTIALTTCCNKQIDENQEAKQEEVLRRIEGVSPPTYLMPYSFEESDQAKGYSAGMIYPYFYQKVWQFVGKKKKNPYEETVLSFIINVAGEMRKKQAVSITDEMQSFCMAKGLANLRDKANCGVFELIDAVQSSFIKGERNAYYEPVLEHLFKLLTGMEMGSIKDTQYIPPIVGDFWDKCKAYHISTQTTLGKETKLDVLSNEEHRQKSYFFHQMSYLETGFCTYEKGLDDHVGIGRILLRERWKYRYTPKVQAVLIDQCVYGGTIREVCIYLLTKGMKGTYQTAQSISQHLLEAEKMGIDELYGALSKYLMGVLGEDMDFLSVAQCFENLGSIAEPIKDLKQLQVYNLKRIGTLIPTISSASKDQEDELCNKFKYVYEYFIEISSSEAVIEEEKDWLALLENLFQDTAANSALVGTVAGVLLRRHKLNLEKVMDKFGWYLQGSQVAKKQAAGFLKGFFKIAKDTLFIEPKMLELIDAILKETNGDEFLEILPDLRLAFTYFLPFEIDKIAKQVGHLYGIGKDNLLSYEAISPKLIEEAKNLDMVVEMERAEWFEVARKG